MSGLGGSSNYGCKAPDGVTCDSVSGTYANAVHDNLPSQRQHSAAPAGESETKVPHDMSATAHRPLPSPSLAAASSPTPLRSTPRILRLWFKPWEDADHDLYDQGYVYVQIDNGQWQIDHVQRRIRDAYAPLKSPPRLGVAGGDAKDAPMPASRPKGLSRPAPADNIFPELPTLPDPGKRGTE